VKKKSRELKNRLDELAKGSNSGLYSFEGLDYNPKGRTLLEQLKLSLPTIPNQISGVTTRSGKRAQTSNERPPGQPICEPHQFFSSRLLELYDKEAKAYRLKKAYDIQRRRGKVETENENYDFGDLTEEEEEEKNRLSKEAFLNWDKKDFNKFLKACEVFGRDSIEDIAIPSKTVREVKEYSEVFWKRYKEIPNIKKKNRRNKKDRGKNKKYRKKMKALEYLISVTPDPWNKITLPYPTSHPEKKFSPDEDRYLICCVFRYGFGSWSEIKVDIAREYSLKNDWHLRSLTEPEIQRRCTTLIDRVQKDLEDKKSQLRKRTRKQKTHITKWRKQFTSNPKRKNNERNTRKG